MVDGGGLDEGVDGGRGQLLTPGPPFLRYSYQGVVPPVKADALCLPQTS